MTEPQLKKPGKVGAPAGNRNRMTWGGRGWAAIGSYPKGFSAVRRYVGRMRAELEDAVCEQHGQVSPYHAALIQSACRHEGRALHLQRRLRLAVSPSLADEMAILREIGSATDSRDKCLKSMGIDATGKGDHGRTLDARYGLSADPAWQESPDGVHEVSTSGNPVAANMDAAARRGADQQVDGAGASFPPALGRSIGELADQSPGVRSVARYSCSDDAIAGPGGDGNREADA